MSGCQIDRCDNVAVKGDVVCLEHTAWDRHARAVQRAERRLIRSVLEATNHPYHPPLTWAAVFRNADAVRQARARAKKGRKT